MPRGICGLAQTQGASIMTARWTDYTIKDGLHGAAKDGTVYAGSRKGISQFKDGQWKRVFPLDPNVDWTSWSSYCAQTYRIVQRDRQLRDTNADLQIARTDLEKHVALRTQELQYANEQLILEVAERELIHLADQF